MSSASHSPHPARREPTPDPDTISSESDSSTSQDGSATNQVHNGAGTPHDPSADCPSDAILAQYATGVAPQQQAELVAGHVATCDACRNVVEWLQAHPQPIDSDDSVPIGETGLQSIDSEDSVPFDETGPHVMRAPSWSGRQSSSEARFDPSIFGSPHSEGALGTLDKYEVLEVLGSGGMGVVFRAVDMQLRRPVALKILQQELADSQISRRRFIREARAAAAINHPNVVTIYSVEEFHNPPLLAMELVKGQSLQDYIRRERCLDTVECLRIAVQVAFGLAAAHDRGVIHRDIKPGNVMLEEGTRLAKLTDFGLARPTVDNIDLTSHDSAVGTPAYMAPEQVLGEEVDARADLFALGCLIHAMLTGSSPFHGRTAWQIASKVTEWDPPPLSKSQPIVPRFLSDIVEKLLQKDPRERYQSAEEVAELLRGHVEQFDQPSSDRRDLLPVKKSGASASTAGEPASRRLVWLAATGAALLTLAVIFPSVFQPWAGQESGEIAPLMGGGFGEVAGGRSVAGEITVAKQGADFDSIWEALEHAAPGAIIRVLDSEVYTMPLVIDDDARWRGVQLISDRQATLSAPFDTGVIRIHATQDVVIRGFRMRVAYEQQGIEVTGACPGLQIRDLDITRYDASESETRSLALLNLHDGARGTKDRPILVENLKVRNGDIGISIGEESIDDGRPRSGWIQVRNCDLSAANYDVGYPVIIAAMTEHIEISNNLIATSSCGISLWLKQANDANDITIKENTFHNLGCFLVMNEAHPEQSISFVGNLISNTAKPLYVQAVSDLPPHWFQDNRWLKWKGDQAELGPIAEPLSGSFISTTPDTDGYLELKADPPSTKLSSPLPGRQHGPLAP